jgi:hypothetical protein
MEYEQGARLYRIPDGGVLMSQFPPNGGCMNDHRLSFFYVDSLGRRTPLFYFLDMEGVQIPKEENYILFTLLSNKEKPIQFVTHLVGNATEFKEMVQQVRMTDPEKVYRDHLKPLL